MTQHYVGTKIIEAWPQERDGVAGYAVKYPDGYTSWSPKDVFEAAYLPLGTIGNYPPHVQRMIGELAQADDRIKKLQRFMASDAFRVLDSAEQQGMAAQMTGMRLHHEALNGRVQRATGLFE